MEPTLGTIVAWHACSHLAPAFEGDLLSFEHRLLAEHRSGNGLTLRAYETTGFANRPADDGAGPHSEQTEVLRWVPVAVTRT
jgi:hypothetical protein